MTPRKIRLSLDVTPEMKAVLEDLREGATHAAVLRQAISLLKTAKDGERRGERLVFMAPDGTVTARLVGY